MKTFNTYRSRYTWGLALCAVLLMAGCAEKAELGGNNELPAEQSQTAPVPVGFSSYMQRTMTRAGGGGEMSTTALQTGVHKTAGFGVFAYYHNDFVYDGQGEPDFMYNQQVAYQEAAGGVPAGFYYSPLRYWPNETGGNAQSNAVDRLSFFAYAPWVDVDAETGLPLGAAAIGETGITSVSRNRQKGDPIVGYRIATNPDQAVDLCWAEPLLNKTRMDYSGGTDRVTLQFHHATAKLNVTVDAQVDDLTATDNPAGGALTADGQSRIYVRSITFTGLAAEGMLNLNSSIYNDPSQSRWQGTDGSASIKKDPVTIHDGRYDGMEGVTVDEGESLGGHGLNPDLIQHTTWGASGEAPGVTRRARNLFAATAEPAGATDAEIATRLTAPVYVIPTGMEMKVTIVYDIETSDDLAGTVSDGQTSGISIENRITKTITTDGTTPLILKAGKAYTLNLHLGLNSVKFDAKIADWEDVSSLIVRSDEFKTTGAFTWTAPQEGDYQLEVWGAQGGQGTLTNKTAFRSDGGYGGYARGVIHLQEGDKLYICVGGQGAKCTRAKVTAPNGEAAGGYNGGGIGGTESSESTPESGSGGGGATHIATTMQGDGQLVNYKDYKDDVLLVAGGGGGNTSTMSVSYGYGGSGGGIGGGNSCSTATYGGVASSSDDTWFGKGQRGISPARTGANYGAHGGGGGGWYGGTDSGTPVNTNSQGGGGGSGHANTTKLSRVYGEDGVRQGNGYTKISLLKGSADLPSN